MSMPRIRRKLTELSKECEARCQETNWVGINPQDPNFRLLYSSVESYEAGNKIAILGMNPAGGPEHAKPDDLIRPFREPGYSAYLDDSWGYDDLGQSPLQRVVQGLAMILSGASPSDGLAALDGHTRPNMRINDDATALLRNSPSGNIIPFRSSKLTELPSGLTEHGERIGWQLLSLVRPKPRVIITLANGLRDPPWCTILKNSAQPLKADFEEWTHKGMRRKYREVRLVKGPLLGALIIGLPAVVRDKGRLDVTKPMFDVLAQRIRHHALLTST